MRGPKWLLTSCLGVAGLVAGGCNPDPLQPLGASGFVNPPQTTTVVIQNYRPAQGNVFQDVFVSNFTVKAGLNSLSLSTSNDGLADSLKLARTQDYGFSPGSPYSVNPGFSDLVLYLLGVRLSQQASLTCASALQSSSSNDAIIYAGGGQAGAAPQFLGLRDCEKMYLGLDPNGFDFNHNGIPDYLKLRCGLNPRDPRDYRLSSSGDGVSAYDKCKEHIPIDEDSRSQPNTAFAYQYKIELLKDGSRTVTVANIPLLNGGLGNLVAFYVIEANSATQAESLATAFTVLGATAPGGTLKFKYWATTPATTFNQEIVAQ